MLKRSAILAAAVIALSASSAQAQIATIDVNSIAQLQQLEQQLSTLQNQYQNQIQQLEAMTGTTSMGSIGGNSAYNAAQKFPEQWDDVYSSGNAYESQAEQTLSRLDNETDSMSIDEAQEYNRERVRLNNAQDRAVMQKIYDDNQAEMENLNELQQEIKTATTQKEIEDLQARIGVSQGTINAQQMRMQNMASLQDAQQRMYEDQRRRAVMRKIQGDEGSVKSPSLSFGN